MVAWPHISISCAFGNIGDRYGRLRILMAGAVIFGAGSFGAAYSQSPLGLIAARALMGLGGASLLPSGLAIVSALFPEPRLRARAIGIFAATFAAGFAIGPLIGGMLLRQFEWGSVFLINIPVVLAFLILAPFLLRDVRSTTYGKIDLPSLCLSSIGILLFTWSLKTAAAEGLTLTQSTGGIIGIIALGLFLRRQTRAGRGDGASRMVTPSKRSPTANRATSASTSASFSVVSAKPSSSVTVFVSTRTTISGLARVSPPTVSRCCAPPATWIT